MYRFVAFIWNPVDEKEAASARTLARRLQSSAADWHCVLERDGLHVFHTGARRGATEAYRLSNNTGVILGKLFRRTGEDSGIPTDATFDAPASRAITDTQAKHLTDQFWGRYVAFLWDEGKRRHYVVRDPTGGLPCIFIRTLGIAIFMSDLEDYIPLEAAKLSVNWHHVAAQFWNLRVVSKDTGFQEVLQLYAGECMTIERGAMVGAFRWEPTQVYDSAPLLENPDHARTALRSAVRSSIRSWASCYESIIHQLSGGLDSAIVASCLSGAKDSKNIVCVNFSTETQDGDERSFARQAARKAGIELVEGRWRTSDRALERLLDTRRHAAPFPLYSETDRLLERLTRERGATAVFSGQGGDHLFQFRRSPFIAAEFLSRHGLRRGFPTVVADTSRLTKQSIWSILCTALSSGLLKRQFDPYIRHEKSILLTNEARAGLAADALAHPWVTSANRLPVSKIEQVEAIVDAQFFYLKPYSFADTIHPLISQPVIECCLRIPTYVLARGGINRQLVREAFRDELPPKIANRITKGTTSGYFNRLAIENAQFLREYLLDGMLVSAHILNKQELERQLSEKLLMRGELLFDIFTAARVEAWLRSWASVWRRVAA